MGEPIATVGDLAGICGHDGTNWEKILIDSSKRLVVAIASAIAQDAQMHGYISSAWQKQPLLFGYGSRWVEDLGGTVSGTNYTGTATTVPSGEIWIVQAIVTRDMDTADTNHFHNVITSGAVVSRRLAEYDVGIKVAKVTFGEQVLCEGDYVSVFLSDCSDGDDIEASVWGYKMDIDL